MVLALVTLGLKGAIVLAIAETGILLAPATHCASKLLTTSDVAAFVVSVWVTVVLLAVISRLTFDLAQWAWRHFEQGRRLLEESRDRQSQLKQALEDLAYANQQLALLNEKLVAMRGIAEEARRAKAAFVANVSHEFRTPLNMIIGLIDVVKENPGIYGRQLPLSLVEDLSIVHRNCEHLAGMINDVLDLSQIEAGYLVLHKESVDLEETIESTLATVRPLLNKKHLQLQVLVPDDLPTIYCDRTRIRQVILNLLSNAARFTERGSIRVSARNEGGAVVVSVQDTGPGISPEHASHIFEPFHQAATGISGQKGGTGLGLSISRKFIELHSGRIWLESEPGRGSTFSFAIPVSPPIEPVAKPEGWIAEGWVQRRLGPSIPRERLVDRIVVCDETDSQELCQLFSRYLPHVHFVPIEELDLAPDGLQACPAQALIVNSARAERVWPLVQTVREKMPDTPIIGCALPPRIDQASGLGTIGYLVKPLKRADLDRVLQDIGKPIQRVLVVDDDADAIHMLTLMLRACNSGLDIISATSGPAGLHLLEEQVPDVLLLDILMPGMDGWELLKAKNQQDRLRDIPVVLISAQDPHDKPVRSDMFVATLGEGLSVGKLLRCVREVSAMLLQAD